MTKSLTAAFLAKEAKEKRVEQSFEEQPGKLLHCRDFVQDQFDPCRKRLGEEMRELVSGEPPARGEGASLDYL